VPESMRGPPFHQNVRAEWFSEVQPPRSHPQGNGIADQGET
jgi:hypothetical protein